MKERVLAYVALSQDRELTRADVAVGAALVWHFNSRTGRCDPGIGRLCRETGYKRRAVFTSLRRLEARGYIGRARHGGGALTNAYTINWLALVEFAETWETCNIRNVTPQTGARECTPPVHGSALTGARECTQTLEETLEEKPKGKIKNYSGVSGCTAQAKWNHPNAPRDPVQGAIRKAATKLTPESKTVARDKAMGRLEKDLLAKFPALYMAALDKLTQDIWDRATAAELKTRGAGCRVALEALEAGRGRP